MIPLDNLSPARVRKRALQCPGARIRRCHARLLLSDVPVACAGKLAESAPALVLPPPVPSDDLVCRVAPRQPEERGQPSRAIRRLADDFRNVIRCYNEWTSKTLYLPRFVVGVSCKSVSVLGVLECPFRMPVASRVIAFLIVLRSSTMSASGQFMLFRRLFGVIRGRLPPRGALVEPFFCLTFALPVSPGPLSNISPTELRSGERRQSGGRRPRTCHRCAVLDTEQGVMHLRQRLRRQGIFLERFRCALRGGGVIIIISDFSFTRNARFPLKARHVR